MPPSTTEPEASSAAGVGANPQLPWASIPKFTPGVTNVQEYTQKLKFLAAMWPSDSLELLAPRAALLVEGTAFRKVARLDPSKLKVPGGRVLILININHTFFIDIDLVLFY